MVNEKCRDAVTDLYLILDSRDLARIGTVLKNPSRWARLGRQPGSVFPEAP